MQIDLSGKRVLITGGTRGIGRAIADGFAAEGARVAICARDQGAVDAAGLDLSKTAAGVIAASVDVQNTEQVRSFVNRITEEWGGVDVLVNNAGRTHAGTIDNTEPHELLAHGDLLQISHFRVAQAVVPHMRKQRWGRIIDINAVVGHVPTSGGIGAAVNRAACIALARSLGMYLAPDNILVNTINLGFLESTQWDSNYENLSSPAISREQFMRVTNEFVPIGRLGRADEVVGMALFLSSERASYITGASIDISGGLFGQIAYFPTLIQNMNAAAEHQRASASPNIAV